MVETVAIAFGDGTAEANAGCIGVGAFRYGGAFGAGGVETHCVYNGGFFIC
jgi:hypothetical protein